MRIDGNRVRGSPRGWRSRRGIERRNTLDQSLVLRVDHAEYGAERVRARGGVVPSVPGVEPDFVRSPNARNPLVDCARFCVQNDLDGDRWVRIRRTPRMTDGVEDYAATNEQILVRTEGESGGLAEVHRKQRRLHRATTLRVDSYDRAFVEPADAGRCRGTVVSAGVDIADDLVCCEVDGYHPAVGVGDKQPASVRGNHDAVGTGSVVAPREPLERLRPGGFDLPDEEIPLGVDDFDGSIGAIGQIVELGARVDPADIEDDQAGDRNGREKADRPSIPPVVLVSAARPGAE